MAYSKYSKGPRRRKIHSEQDLIKYLLKNYYKRTHPVRQERKSLLEDARVHYSGNEYGDGFVEYGFIKGSEFWTDDDVQEWIECEWQRICSPYDCTGLAFTQGIDWHRNPSGIVSYQHYKGIDV